MCRSVVKIDAAARHTAGLQAKYQSPRLQRESSNDLFPLPRDLQSKEIEAFSRQYPPAVELAAQWQRLRERCLEAQGLAKQVRHALATADRLE